jgi:hypothetical protein
MDDSYRCGNCGGVWVKAWIINAMAEEPYKEIRIKRYEIRKDDKAGEIPRCPGDGSWLSRSQEDTLPPDVPMWQCGKCKNWWLPGNSIFDLAEAFRIKAEFAKRWRKNTPATSMTLPVILTLVLAIGLGLAVATLRSQQQVNVAAQTVVTGTPAVIYLGQERAEIRFKTDGDLQTAAIKREGENN